VANWLQRLGAKVSAARPERTAGDPPSANGASSFHLRWDLRGSFTSAAVTLEVLEPPVVDRLYFWALQADFADPTGRPAGGAHLGLQWYPPHPGSTAVNWGGYDRRGRILDGSVSVLPSATGNANTRDLAWEPGRPYRLAISRLDDGPEGGGAVRWSGTVTDDTGVITTVRDLYVHGGVAVSGVVMWSEVFARCDHPSVAVRWSDPSAVTAGGEPVRPATVSVNYQRHDDGGCANTDSSVDGIGIVQRTATERVRSQGTVLAVPH
jgi:hypothetical protein